MQTFQNALQVKNEHLEFAFKQSNGIVIAERSVGTELEGFNKTNGRDMDAPAHKGVICFLNS